MVGGTRQRHHLGGKYQGFQCSQSSRGWWNETQVSFFINDDDSFSALSRAVVGGTEPQQGLCSSHRQVSVLSVEPWLVEPSVAGGVMDCAGVSVLSVEPWLVEQFAAHTRSWRQQVSVLSVEPWLVEPGCFSSDWPQSVRFQCSQSSRGWWNAAITALAGGKKPFQCSQSSRGWWNPSALL